jgi:hypothetical protein
MPEEDAIMFCPQCGAPNEDDSVFCGNCGMVLDPENLPAETVEEMPVEPREVPAEISPVDELAVRPPPPPPPPTPPTYAVAPSVPTSGLAIASLALGIGGLTILPLLGSILAIVFGYMARRDIRQRPDEISGSGLAVAGIVLGWISVGLALLGVVIFGGMAVCGLCGAIGASGVQ